MSQELLDIVIALTKTKILTKYHCCIAYYSNFMALVDGINIKLA